MLKVMQALTLLSKERHLVNIVLSTTDSAFPSKLAGMRVQLAHITKAIVVGDMGPSKMNKLLRDEWQVGEHLANALLACYGGHVVTASNGIDLIRQYKSEYMTTYALRFGFTYNVHSLINLCEGDAALLRRCEKMLTDLAEKGFHQISSVDELSEMAVACGVAEVVTMQSRTPWVPKSIRSREGGLVPTLQSMRLNIALVLHDRRTELAGKRADRLVRHARVVTDTEALLNKCGISPVNSRAYAETLVGDLNISSTRQLIDAVQTGQPVSFQVLASLIGPYDLDLVDEALSSTSSLFAASDPARR